MRIGGPALLPRAIANAPAIHRRRRTFPCNVAAVLAWPPPFSVGAGAALRGAVSLSFGLPVRPRQHPSRLGVALQRPFPSVPFRSGEPWIISASPVRSVRSPSQTTSVACLDRPVRTPLLRFLPLQRSPAMWRLSGLPLPDDPASALAPFTAVESDFAAATAQHPPVRFSACVGDGTASRSHASSPALLAADPASLLFSVQRCQPSAGRAAWLGRGSPGPGGALGVLYPSQSCSCPRVSRCFHLTAPTCRCLDVRLDGFGRGAGRPFEISGLCPIRYECMSATDHGTPKSGFWVLSPQASRALPVFARRLGRYCLGLCLSQVSRHPSVRSHKLDLVRAISLGITASGSFPLLGLRQHHKREMKRHKLLRRTFPMSPALQRVAGLMPGWSCRFEPGQDQLPV